MATWSIRNAGRCSGCSRSMNPTVRHPVSIPVAAAWRRPRTGSARGACMGCFGSRRSGKLAPGCRRRYAAGVGVWIPCFPAHPVAGCSLAGRPGRIGRHWTYSTIGRHERISRVSGDSAGRVANTAGRQIRKMFGGSARQSQFHLRKSPRSGPCSSGSEVCLNRAFKRASNPIEGVHASP